MHAASHRVTREAHNMDDALLLAVVCVRLAVLFERWTCMQCNNRSGSTSTAPMTRCTACICTLGRSCGLCDRAPARREAVRANPDPVVGILSRSCRRAWLTRRHANERESGATYGGRAREIFLVLASPWGRNPAGAGDHTLQCKTLWVHT